LKFFCAEHFDSFRKENFAVDFLNNTHLAVRTFSSTVVEERKAMLPHKFVVVARPFLLQHRYLWLSSMDAQKFRIERDTFGELQVPVDKYYGAQTAR
jgi:hypothetical protein